MSRHVRSHQSTQRAWFPPFSIVVTFHFEDSEDTKRIIAVSAASYAEKSFKKLSAN